MYVPISVGHRALLVATTILVTACSSRIPGAGAVDGGESAAGKASLPDTPTAPAPSTEKARVYEVRKKVKDFPGREDLSTPEAACASIVRARVAEGEAAWPRLSVPELVARIPKAAKQALPARMAERLLNAEILEVHVWEETQAVVIVREHAGQDSYIHWRSLARVQGRWLNRGAGGADTIEHARREIARIRSYEAAKRLRDERPPITDPAAHLRPFVDFLKREGKDPQQFVMDALAKYRVVILGEIHHRPRYWAFNAALVRSLEFAQHVGVIYLELPSNDQPLVDRFLAAPKYDPHPVVDTLRDMLSTGWPDQPNLDFFRTVWEVNQQLPESQRLRIVLVDTARPWSEIKKAKDWEKYQVNRDLYMAENVIRDLGAHAADRRHALFIVGHRHAKVSITQLDGEPMKSAAWYLRGKLGASSVFALFPHGPVMSDDGRVEGRLALGLFETAFAAVGNKPLAFPLDHGPFGEQLFDADRSHLTADLYRNGFQAYLYLGPLENEVFATLIPGFYSDEFVREVDRRMRLTEGKGLVASGMVKRLDGPSVAAAMSHGLGRMRREWSASRLGPLDAWKYGSRWEAVMRRERHAKALEAAEEISAAARRLFEAIRAADYGRDWLGNGQCDFFLADDVDYAANRDYPGWVSWVCMKFRANPIRDVQLGKVFLGRDGLPTVHYELRLKDGEVLQGDLPFQWDPRSGRWGGWESLDWHLRNPSWMEKLRQGFERYFR